MTDTPSYHRPGKPFDGKTVFLATLCINEMEWLPYLYEQHNDWPNMAGWCFVEAADRIYAETNPDLVTSRGLSVDGTSEYLQRLAENDSRVTYIPFGFSDHSNPALCKIEARRRYIEIARKLNPNFLIILDADEFYTYKDQARLLKWMSKGDYYDSFVFPKREIWRPPSIAHRPLFEYEAVGRFWSMACCHWWRWYEDVDYRECHNTPQRADGTFLNKHSVRWEEDNRAPEMIHMGYSSCQRTRIAKIRYYEERGEKRQFRAHVEARSTWLNWQPGDDLEWQGGEILPYNGPIPEVFLSEDEFDNYTPRASESGSHA